MKIHNLTGVNIQWPWSRLLLDGKKTVETRKYSLPSKYRNVPLAIIETAGPRGLKEAGITRAQIVGVILFSDSFRYASYSEWLNDIRRHRVSPTDSSFAWDGKQDRWGWVVEKVIAVDAVSAPPSPRGIVFASNCSACVSELPTI
jgi:hypothetical protein